MKLLVLILSIFIFNACGTVNDVSTKKSTTVNVELNVNNKKEENKNAVSKQIKTVKPNDLVPGRTIEIKRETTNTGDKNQDSPKSE